MKIKKRYGKYGGYLPHCVDRDIIRRIKKEEANNPEYYIRVDDKFFILNEALITDSYKHIGFFIYGISLLYIIGRFSINKEISFGFSFLLILAGSLSILYYYKHPKKELILDRMNGMITFPNYFYFKPFTMPFEDCLVAWSVKNSGASPTAPRLSLLHPNGFTSTDVMGADILEDWCFMNWYMDKNRPLPPGTAFDEYRLQDFERRKAEGFPKPLFPGSFHTPERTPSQHRQRKEIGGW
ncbi:hypothetical protein Celal_1662 [Cellulophaga algicola DSM 14237]|uniref:Transmembrane protein n=1 Tax=Cellulophaga algicola (strain DSM 14237 / IC166 / ACAM 630) TaxID=688270 RepID=E6XBW9_CELAD|nr:hypothetical protein [Cellulophaga algicola]ADV48971.1 hypothetical protein Celal_1662 [Cellulophaga algicola DSM 14237]